MTEAELIAEGERLAKPGVLLRDEGAPEALAAVWGGPGPLPKPSGEYRHWLTFNCRFLPAGLEPAVGCVGVYTTERDSCDGLAIHDSTREVTRNVAGRPLYAQSACPLPPIDALFRFGGPSVQRWLRECQWEPEEPYNENFRDRAIVDKYERRYQSEYPLYTEVAVAVLGGWHFPWPDGDWADLLADSLLAWTIEDSEPWVEVWRTGNSFRVLERIT